MKKCLLILLEDGTAEISEHTRKEKTLNAPAKLYWLNN